MSLFTLVVLPWMLSAHPQGQTSTPASKSTRLIRDMLSGQDLAKVESANHLVQAATGNRFIPDHVNVMLDKISRPSLRLTGNSGQTLLELDRETGMILHLYLGAARATVVNRDRGWLNRRALEIARSLSKDQVSSALHPGFGVVADPSGTEFNFVMKSPDRFNFNPSCLPTIAVVMAESGDFVSYTGLILKFDSQGSGLAPVASSTVRSEWSRYWGGTRNSPLTKPRLEYVVRRGTGSHGSFRRNSRLMLGERTYQLAYVYDLGAMAQVWLDPRTGAAVGGVYSREKLEEMEPTFRAKAIARP